MRSLRFIVFVLALSATAIIARAQAVHWELGDSGVGTAVQLVFEDCEPDGMPDLPTVPGASFSFAGRSESMSIVNFNTSRSVTLSYVVRARQSGPIQIPAFTVKTNKGVLRVAAFSAGAGASISADAVATSKLIPEKTTVWAGEVFGLAYQLSAARRNNPQINATFDWNPAPLSAEDWSKPEQSLSAGGRDVEVTFRTRVYAKTPNTVKLPAVNHLLQVQTGTIGFGLFSQARMEPISVTSDQPVIEVRSLPTPPAGFSGAVGEFKLVSKVVPEKAAVGEPVTWTLELSGTGNWPDIAGLPARDVSNDFQVVQPKAKRTPAEGKLFDVTLSEDVVLVPTKAGRYTLGPVAFTYFDPKSGSYKTINAPRTTVTISAPANAPLASAPAIAGSSTGGGDNTGTAAATNRRAPVAPAFPAGIPRDPLPGSEPVALPLSPTALLGWLIAPLVGVLVLWLTLALRKARETDPARPRREAHARLSALLASLRQSAPEGRGSAATLLPQLRAWQIDTAILWQIAHAAPDANAFLGGTSGSVESAHNRAPAPDGVEWAALWREADRALYGADHTLPPDWVARAEAALAAKPAPRFQPARLFRPQNLLPFAAAIVALLALAMGATTLVAADSAANPPASATSISPTAARSAYDQADFSTAEKGWRAAVGRQPTDWIARHNLSLALAQQDRTLEAAAQAAAAFVQHPSDSSVRWHFALLAEKSGVAPAPLVPFLNKGPLSAIATLAGPARWQRVLIIATFGLAAALGWMLVNAYGRRSRVQFFSAGGIAVAAVLVGIVAITSIVAFGETADIRAAVAARATTLRSIPTEADTTQKTTPLAAGAVAIVDNSFLGWQRLVFANGQTGWVRKDDIVPLWR